MLRLVQSGVGRARGRQHGEELRPHIQALVAIRKGLTHNYWADLPSDDRDSLLAAQLEVLEHHAELYAEFRGTAEAANVSLSDLMLLNNYTDLRDYSFSPDPEADARLAGEGCSAVSLRSEGAALCGQTWDMHASAQPYVLWIQVCEGIHAHILTVAGCFGLAGVNELGVAVCINNMHSFETAEGGRGLMS